MRLKYSSFLVFCIIIDKSKIKLCLLNLSEVYSMFAVTRKFEAVKKPIDILNCTVLLGEPFGHLTLAKMIKNSP